MIVLDLEWNRGYDKKPLNEILQIGAVRIERLGGPVVDVFNACIRPTVHKKFDQGAKKLPDREKFQTSRIRFPEAAEAFRTWCAGETAFAAWGMGDMKELNENCKYWRLAPFQTETAYNFQRAFGHALGTDRQIALWRAVEYCRIPDVFDYHSAVNDAMYTALLSKWITLEDLVWEPEPALLARGRRLVQRMSPLPFPEQLGQMVGPMSSPRNVLDAKSSRRPACPLCARSCGVARWVTPNEGKGTAGQYYTVCACPEHGRFLCRMTLTQKNGKWWGQWSVPPITQELAQEYVEALEGSVHVCKKNGGRGRRRKKAGAGVGKQQGNERKDL